MSRYRTWKTHELMEVRQSGIQNPNMDLIDSGVYIAIFRLPEKLRILVGNLGTILFQPGVYLYVGSAQRGLMQRIQRHARRHKRKHWHIDYLSVKAAFVGAIVIEAPKEMECKVAQMLTKRHGIAVAGFGCTDCRCGSHLFRVSKIHVLCAADAIERGIEEASG